MPSLDFLESNPYLFYLKLRSTSQINAELSFLLWI